MKGRRIIVLLIAVLGGMLALAACGAGGGTSGSSGGAPTATATATAKPKPTGVPEVTMPYCQGLMTVAEANQIMRPPTPATTVDAQSDDELGVCTYKSAQAQFAVVKILLERKAYTGPRPAPASAISQLVAQLEDEPGGTVTTATPVSGVGDQAEFLAASVTQGSITFYVDVVYVLYGNVVFLCDDFHLGSKPDDATQQSALQQCAQLVVSRL